MNAYTKERPTRIEFIPMLLLSISLYSPIAAAQEQPTARNDIAATSRVLEQLSARLAPAVVEVDVKAWEVSDAKEDSDRAG